MHVFSVSGGATMEAAMAAYDKCEVGETAYFRPGDDSVRNFQNVYVQAEMMQDDGLIEILALEHQGQMVSAVQFKRLK